MARTLIPALMALLLAGCGGGPEEAPENTAAPELRRLDPAERLVRVSMTLRGIRPSPEELDAVRADPDALEGIVDAYLESEAFAQTVRDLHAETFLLRRDTFEMLPALGALEGYDLGEIHRSQVNEPLQLVEHIVMNDRPYTEIVTADYMFTDEIISKMYGVPYDPAGPEWQESWWTDGRPAAGLLSSAEMLRRWESNGSNFNRARANMVASRFLCSDFDTRDISVAGGIDVADELAVAQAVKTEPSCIGCHQTLDPLAGYFWGYMRVVRRDAVRDAVTSGCAPFDYSDGAEPPYGENHLPEFYCYPIQQYAPFAEDDWRKWDLRSPGYFGTPAHDLADVGELIANDPRFSMCMARHWYGYFAQVPPMEVPFEIAAELQQVLVESEFDAKALARAAALHETLAMDADGLAADPTHPVVSLKTVRPEQTARMIEELTGYRWVSRADPFGCAVGDINGTQCWGDVELMTSDLFGFRAMSGGVDGFTVTRPLHALTPTKLLAGEELAQDAAAWVVAEDFAVPAEERRLLALVEPDTVDEAAIRAQLVALFERITGRRVAPGSDDITLYTDLWKAVHAGRGDVETAWIVTLAALLQDPAVWFY